MSIENNPNDRAVADRYRESTALANQNPFGVAGAPDMPWMDADQQSGGVNIPALMHSLRRRWPMALVVGGLCASAVAVLLWMLLPTNYTAEALLRVNRQSQTWEGKNRYETDKAYETFRETQANYIKSTWIIGRALRNKPEIEKFMILRGHPDKAAWISEEIKARPMGESELLQLLLSGESKKEVTTLLNEVMKAYREEVITKARQRQENRLRTLDDTIVDHQNQISRIEKDYIQQCEALDLPADASRHRARQELVMSSLAQLRSQQRTLGIERSEVESEIVTAQALLKSPPSQIPEQVILDELDKYPQYFQLKERRSENYEEMERVQSIYGASSNMASQLRSEIGRLDNKMKSLRRELEPRIIARLRREEGNSPQDLRKQIAVMGERRKGLVNQQQELQDQLAEVLVDAEKLSESNAELSAKSDKLDQLKSVLDDLQRQRAFLAVEKKQPPRVEFVTPQAEIRESSDLWIKIVEVFGAAGLTFGLVVVGIAFWDYQSKRVNSATEFAATSDLRVLGTLPLVHNTNILGIGRKDARALETILSRSADSVRAAVVYNRLVSPLRTLMITSAVDQEGRTTLASQLAISMARSGRRTLLIDADTSNPGQHLVFNVSGDSGLCDLLNGSGTQINDVVCAATVENLWILPAGSDSRDVQFTGEPVEALFQALRDAYDFVIVETGPVLTGAESLMVGQYVDACLLSVRRDESRLSRIHAATDRLRAVGITILGAVVHSDGNEARRTSVPKRSKVPQIAASKSSPKKSVQREEPQPSVSDTIAPETANPSLGLLDSIDGSDEPIPEDDGSDRIT